jgi:hypothetical protein
LFRKTESFDISIEPKQTEDQPKQFDREHILVFFQQLKVFPVCFGLFLISLFQLFRFYTETESFDVLIEPKQTEDQPKQIERAYFGIILKIYGCFSLFRNKSKIFVFGFTKQTETQAKQILFRFVTRLGPKFFCFVSRTP